MVTDSELADDAELPVLREDLRLLNGAPQFNGERSWLIYDPPRHRYFQIDAPTVALLKNWSAGNVGEVKAAASAEVEVANSDVEEVIRFLYTNSLTLNPPENDTRNYASQASAGKQSKSKWLVHNYLFFRIPLFRPNAFLQRTQAAVSVFFSRLWWIFLSALLVLSLYLVMRQWDEFAHTFLHFFSLKGLSLYMISLVVVKSFHELGHAYALTRYGGRVATMGVAFLVMFPVLYTDTTDSWKLRSRRERLIVSGAGVGVELMIAVLATFAWAFLPDGPWRSVAFFAATTSWLLSLAVNLNPLIRFDGYHFLADAIGIQNLQARSFAMGRWALREMLFDLGEPVPEIVTRNRRRGLTLFAWACWTYRFFLFLAIAVLVYTFFFKALGVILFVIEIMWFIAMPIYSELSQWWERRVAIAARPRARLLGVSGLVLLAVLFVPWQWTVRIPAVLEVAEQIAIYPQGAGRVSAVHVEEGQQVLAGDLLLSIEAPELDNSVRQSERRLQLLNARLNRTAVDAQDLEQTLVLQRERLREQATLTGLQAEQLSLQVFAPKAGRVVDVAKALHVGRWVNESLELANLISDDSARVRGYVTGEEVRRLAVGAESRFVPDLLELDVVDGRLANIADTYAERISIPALSSRFQGDIAVSETSQDLEPLGAWYGVLVELEEGAYMPKQVVPGMVHTQGEAESLAAVAWRQIMRVLIRESSV